MSLILSAATRFLMPLLLLFSVFLLLTGHNAPGGGFSGGLVASAAFALHMVASDAATTRRVLRGQPRVLIPVGLIVALLSGLVAVVRGQPFLTGGWTEVVLPGNVTLHVGTPLIFDVGVYLVVVGVTLTIILSLADVQEA